MRLPRRPVLAARSGAATSSATSWQEPTVRACGRRKRATALMLSNTGVDGFSLAGYEVEALLGFGGTGEVWSARESTTGERVALKRLRGTDAAPSRELQREAALLASARHEHVVRLRSVVPTPGGLVLVLDFAAGGSLASLLGARGRLTAAEVVTIGAPLAQALADVHERGITHGDVTPANIVFDAA